MDIDLVVVGAGLAGSCLAAAVAARGWRVALVERRQGPHHKVCGEFLSPEAQASFRGLGLHAAVADLQPATMTGATLVSRSGLSLSLPLPGVAWGVSRYALDHALATAAAGAGANLRYGVTATAVRPNRSAYTVELRDAQGERQTLTARAAVIACGRHAGPGLRPGVQHAERAGQKASAPPGQVERREIYVGVKCHYEGLRLAPEVRLYLFDGGYVGLSPIEGGRANLCMLVSEAAFQRAGKSPEAMIAAVVRGSNTLAHDLAGGQLCPESMVTVGAVDTERTPVLWGPCARLGDAVAMIPPLCGDGQAMAIRAAELSAPLVDEVLRGRRSPEAWAAAYSAAWHAEFDGPLRAGRRLQALLGLPGLGTTLLGLGHLAPALARRVVLATRGPQRDPAG